MSLIEAVFNHLVLPPKLPDGQDKDLKAIENKILNYLVKACSNLQLIADEETGIALRDLLHSLTICGNINQELLDKKELLAALRALRPEQVLIIHLVEQNAALLTYHNKCVDAPAIIFEAFEASPTSENVLKSQCALQWDFPARAVQITVHQYEDESFLQCLADFLEKASSEHLSCFAAQAKKAGTSVAEVRNTTSPILITEMLMALLEGLGSVSSVPCLRKRVRDDVNIRNAEKPWRRLPFWLVLRVAMHRRLLTTLGQEAGHSCYKVLIAKMLADVLEDVAGQLSPDRTLLLKAKLCRRLAKLEKDNEASSSGNRLLASVTPILTDSIERVTQKVMLAWDSWKRSNARRIPLLPLYASNQDLSLSLQNSRHYLEDSLLRSDAPLFTTPTAHTSFTGYNGTQQAKDFACSLFKMAAWESSIPELKLAANATRVNAESTCDKIARSILDMLYHHKDTYDSDPEQMSIFILSLFDLWVQLDRLAVVECPLLAKYRPAFSPELLDVLQLAAYNDMKRLQQIQVYIQDRHKNLEFGEKTIFSDVDESCFAVKYVEHCSRMRGLQKIVEEASEKSRTRKRAEWMRACQQYDHRSQKIAEGTCVCTFDVDGKRDVRGCTRCWHWRSQRKMKISVHEDFLPVSEPHKAAVVFELDIPGFLAAYRNATWRIICDLAHPSKPSSEKPQILLRDYSQLQSFFRGVESVVSLASIPKSFLQTHYQGVRMKAAEFDILLPLALKFEYYDTTSGIWLKSLNKRLTLQHVCGVHIPQCLQTVMKIPEHPPPDLQAPSSYEVVANQTKCSSSTGVHEFSAYQSLMSGPNRRWMTILRELGSSNLNFSSVDTQLLLSHLAIQAGPINTEDDFRTSHIVFRDSRFCERLLEQIGIRLQSILSNWREVHFMELLITLSLRLHTLTSGAIQLRAENLLKTAREATAQWIARLRDEVRTAVTSNVVERASRYGLLAALLCRRTFAFFVHCDRVMTTEELSNYVQASLAVQENLVADPTKLPLSIKNLLARDLKMAFQMQVKARQAIQQSPGGLEAAILRAWSDPSNIQERTFSAWESPSISVPWVMSTMKSNIRGMIRSRTVHYDYVEGHLLIDGKPSGQLPQEIRDSEATKTLFGSHEHLLVYPSSMAEMTHVLASQIYGQEIHFGRRRGETIILALSRGELLQFIPRHKFIGNDHWDLPSSLISDCVHWLNLDRRCLEIRRCPVIWRTRQSDWVVDIPHSRAFRGGSTLVDPSCPLFKQVAKVFEHFEEPRHLTVFQPRTNRLTVEMKRLQLSFSVNKYGRLQSRELGAVIDRNQDAGTLYGLESKIVVCDVLNPDRRSIIVPLGIPTYQLRGMHVVVWLTNADKYGKFDIDNILGRLNSPPEPVLMYTKAMLHAFTSCAIPDTLTRRTGTEEATRILTSGASQPWTPLSPLPTTILKVIKALSPRRQYYPKDRRSLQAVIWDQHLTSTIQHDAYEILVQAIFQRSEELRAFSSTAVAIECDSNDNSHLRQRALSRQGVYQRSQFGEGTDGTAKDLVYSSRTDDSDSLHSAENVFQVVKLICEQPIRFRMKKPLRKTLESWNLIGGFLEDTNWRPSSLREGLENNIREQWGTLVSFARRQPPEQRYELMFFLGLISFVRNADMDIIRFLAACSCVRELRDLPPPQYSSFQEFKLNERPDAEKIVAIIRSGYPEYMPNLNKKKKQWEANKRAHEDRCDKDAEKVAALVVLHWPDQEVFSDAFVSEYLDEVEVIDAIMPEWRRLQRNMALSEYILTAQEVINRHSMNSKITSRRSSSDPTEIWTLRREDVISSLFNNLKAEPLASVALYGAQNGSATRSSQILVTAMDLRSPDQTRARIPKSDPRKSATELGKILEMFSTQSSPLRQRYAQDLKRSLRVLQRITECSIPYFPPPSLSSLLQSAANIKQDIETQFLDLQRALVGVSSSLRWLRLGELMPYGSPMELLALLQSSSSTEIGPRFKEAIVNYGRQITRLQHLSRIRDAELRQNITKVQEELQNAGYENWDPLRVPDWLLLQIESDILIRPEQIDVANAIISPETGRNSLFQLNMGKGKTSCILPMAAAVLANKKQLLRLIVPKALLLQTAQTLQSRLGSLCGRDVSHIPFSRRTSTTADMLDLYSRLHFSVKERCGVLLTAPEHLLSFKLSGLQRLVDCKLSEAASMIKFQEWLDNKCRDVLDESDFTLAVKTQLIYPSGPQMALDGHPHRWLVVEELLLIVENHLEPIQKSYPGSIEVVKRPAGFPMVHFVRSDPEHALHRIIINEISNGRTTTFRFSNPPSNTRTAMIKQILSDSELDLECLKKASRLFVDHEAAYKGLLVVHGLLKNHILLLCLKKRWNVQYGLHPQRDPIAVPFEARGVPSEHAEFGHPDVAMIFTLLAFYYAGLRIDQFCESLQRVLKADDPASEYNYFIQGSDTLPVNLHHWNLINTEDQMQVSELWTHLRWNRNVLNHYANNFVFPLHAKQFGLKLQASAWDLPLYHGHLDISVAQTTGFSGTNDNKVMLPLTICQNDLPGLQQTNAEVLTYLLEDRNRGYKVAAREGKRLSEIDLLSRISFEGIRILIDAGAYILEMENIDVVKKWLELDTHAKAGLYFSKDNRAMVLHRGRKEPIPLVATPFAEDLRECVVYLDEAHTRGVDLKLPLDAVGALTLGPGQTKDHTVQAAMRLRALGTSQSVVFFAPLEVHQSILDVCNLKPHDHINSFHVIQWLLEQTCRANENLQDLYLAQGFDFCRRSDAKLQNPLLFSECSQRKNYLQVLQQPEKRTLEELYGNFKVDAHAGATQTTFKGLKVITQELEAQKKGATRNLSIHSSAMEEVEQEREVEFQVEEVRQVQKPIHFQALKFPGVHKDIKNFLISGVLPLSDSYEHVFGAIARTQLGRKHGARPCTSHLFASVEFMSTVKLGKGDSIDSFLRPVEFILWSRKTETALILIPEEAEALIPLFRESKKVATHLIIYAAPVTKTMLHFDQLSYYVLPGLPRDYAFPDWLKVELGIFAGRLYLSYEDCTPLRNYLYIESDAAKAPRDQNEGRKDLFVSDPAHFLLQWLSLRRKGLDITHTPVGYICQNRSLHAEHAFFTTPQGSQQLFPLVDGVELQDYDDSDDDESNDDDEDGMPVEVSNGADELTLVDDEEVDARL